MGWNGSGGGSTPIKPKVTAKKPSPIRGIVAGLVVVAAACAAYFVFFSGSDGTQKEVVEKKPTKIKEVSPAKAPTNVVAAVPEKPKRLTKKGTPIPDRVQVDEKGIYRYPNGQRWVDPNDLHIISHPKPRVLFNHVSENRIAVMLQLDPTGMDPLLFGRRPKFDQSFVKDFLESFNDTVVIDKEDTPEEAALRKAVLETKADLKAAYDRGEDIAKLMNDSQNELDRLAQYHGDLKKLVYEALENPELSDNDVEDYVKAANQMLESKGIKKFAMPKLINRQAHLMMVRERQKLRQEAEKENK